MASRFLQILAAGMVLLGGAGLNAWAYQRFVQPGAEPLSHYVAVLLAVADLAAIPILVWLLFNRPLAAKKAAVVVGALVLSVFLIDVVTAASGILVPADFRDRHLTLYGLFQPDPELGFTGRPNLRDFLVTWSETGVRVRYSTDQYGLRNVGRDYRKARLFFVGDSFTWGVWVERQDTFPDIIERELQAPVINLAQQSYYMEQYELVIRKFSELYSPNVIALCVFANDLTAPVSPAELKDFYHRFQWDQYRSYPIYKKLFSYQAIDFVKKELAKLEEPPDDDPARPGSHLDTKVGRSGLKFYRQLGAIGNYFYSSYHLEIEKVFGRILEYVKGRGMTPIVFLLPSKESSYKDEYLEVFPSDYLNIEEEGFRRLCEIASNRGVVCVDLTPAFRERSKSERTYFARDPHWNELGHKVAAEEMLQYLKPVMESAPADSPEQSAANGK